jgi:cytochrome c peroxidase
MKILSLAVLTLLGSSMVSAATVTLTPEQLLGQRLYKDKNLSLNRNQACATCHALAPIKVGNQIASSFVDVDNVRQKTPVSAGSVTGKFGGLNAPSSGYAAFSPPFHLDTATNQYIGGQFWNGRAVDLAAQAKGPVLNPAEMGMPTAWAVVDRLKENTAYVGAFKRLYGLNISTVPAFNPQAAEPAIVASIYDRLAHAIGEFEKTPVFNKFNSKFDYVLAGKTSLTALEAKGRTLFEGKAKCSSCHTSDLKMDANGKPLPPLFSNYTYANVGTPRNVNIPNNPAPDQGLGGRDDIAANDPTGLQKGKHKVMTLRNIAMTAPYGHNGVFKTLQQVVHFNNTRDSLGFVADNNTVGFGITGWPLPEVSNNLNVTELGNLGLTLTEERAIVAFLRTLTDNYPTWGNDPKVPVGTPSPFAPVAPPPPPAPAP